MTDKPLCELCGEPMPENEEMFVTHGYSGPCPKPPLEKVAKPAPEIGWVIERGLSEVSAPDYYSVAGGGVKWTKDNLLALRFARKVDAELMALACYGGDHGHRIAEHIWG